MHDAGIGLVVAVAAAAAVVMGRRAAVVMERRWVRLGMPLVLGEDQGGIRVFEVGEFNIY